jgi:DNA-binding transcriptional regulator YiaG
MGGSAPLRKPSLAAALRAEVRLQSRQEVKKAQARMRRMQRQMAELRKTAQGHERVLATMRRRLSGLRSGMRQAGGAVRKAGPQLAPPAIRAVRDRLRMTREQFARLVGVSPGSIFGWESGRTLPRRGSIGRLLELRKVGVRAARTQLKTLGKAARRRVGRRSR